MTKAIYPIVLFVMSLLSISAHTSGIYRAAEGYKAPDFTISNSHQSVSLTNLRGHYVLINFWTSLDAESRIANISYDRVAGSSDSKIKLVSVNLDESQALFNNIVVNDSLNKSMQFHINRSGNNDMAADYLGKSSAGAFLIDPQGNILAINPSAESLAAL